MTTSLSSVLMQILRMSTMEAAASPIPRALRYRCLYLLYCLVFRCRDPLLSRFTPFDRDPPSVAHFRVRPLPFPTDDTMSIGAVPSASGVYFKQRCSGANTAAGTTKTARTLKSTVVPVGSVVVSAANGASSSSSPIDDDLMALMQAVASGEVGAPEAAEHLNSVATWGCPPPASDDSDDSEEKSGGQSSLPLQANFPEVVWGEGKTAEQIATALEKIASRQGMAAATRVPYQTAVEVQNLLPSCEYNATGMSITLKVSSQRNKLPGTVAMITAGTANKHVVEECRVMLQATGCYCFKLPDAGVMGMHRVVENLEAVRAADVVICVTGMDGGVASVVAGMVECPVISLPTSTGYGAAMGGIAALLAALTSSAPGVTVVNIDSGFGAAMAAWRILASKNKGNRGTNGNA